MQDIASGIKNKSNETVGMPSMEIHPTDIDGAFLIKPDIFRDHRGVFFETYNREKFLKMGIDDVFVQDNFSSSSAGVLRGLHFQYPPYEMSKLVRCNKGRLFDVVVDMRRASPSFGKWIGIELNDQDHAMLYIPQGCAHGFYALEDCELMYKCCAMYSKEHDAGLAYDDPDIGINWPIRDERLILSDRDKAHPRLSEILDRLNQ